MSAFSPHFEESPSDEVIKQGVFHVSELSGVSVVDFLPERHTIRFPTLVARANEWLQRHPLWEAKSCESVEFKSKQGLPRVDRVTFLEHDISTDYVRALRLWVIPRKESSVSPQQIGYLNVTPKEIPRCCDYKFERLDSVLAELNSNLASHPLEGRILTIETQPMKFSLSKQEVDADKTYFRDYGFSVIVLRIFYEIGPPCYETVCIKDFQPIRTPRGCCCAPRHSDVPETVAEASEWCRQNPNIRICNIQTVPSVITCGLEGKVHSTKMSIKEKRYLNQMTFYIRVLRIAYVESKTVPPPSAVVYPITCKTFLPVQLTSYKNGEPPNFETTQQTLTRIAEWCKMHNVKIISAETIALRMYPFNEKLQGPESSVIINHSGRQEHFIFYVTLYLEGEYPDPPIMMCPISHRGWRSYPVRSADNIPPLNECCCIL